MECLNELFDKLNLSEKKQRHDSHPHPVPGKREEGVGSDITDQPTHHKVGGHRRNSKARPKMKPLVLTRNPGKATRWAPFSSPVKRRSSFSSSMVLLGFSAEGVFETTEN